MAADDVNQRVLFEPVGVNVTSVSVPLRVYAATSLSEESPFAWAVLSLNVCVPVWLVSLTD